MGRGGEGVGGNWRGVALTHQATVCKNKTSGQGNGTVFFIHLLPLPKGLRKQQQKMTYVSSLTSISLSLLSLTHPSFLRLPRIDLSNLSLRSTSLFSAITHHNPPSDKDNHLYRSVLLLNMCH